MGFEMTNLTPLEIYALGCVISFVVFMYAFARAVAIRGKRDFLRLANGDPEKLNTAFVLLLFVVVACSWLSLLAIIYRFLFKPW